MNQEEIVIIGAGISSLVFCYLLCKSPSCPKLKVTVLEKTSRPGGRIHTLKEGRDYIDAGALRFSCHHKLLWGLIKELGLKDQIEPLPSRTRFFAFDQYITPPAAKYDRVMRAALADPDTSRRFSLDHYVSRRLSTSEIYNWKVFFNYDEKFFQQNMYNFALSSVNYNAEKYYHFTKGYETLVNALLRALRSYKNIRIHFNEKVKSVTRPEPPSPLAPPRRAGGEKGHRFEVKTYADKTYSADRLVFAIPKANLMSIEGLTDLYPLFQSVRPVSLNRVYAKFPSLDWMPRFNIHSDLPLKQVIVINRRKKIMMISYSTNGNAWDCINAEIQFVRLWEWIKPFLEKLVRGPIPRPLWIKQNYWKHATYFWNPNFNSKRVSRTMLQPYASQKLHFIGSAYSEVQGWTEGAITTAVQCHSLIFKKERKGSMINRPGPLHSYTLDEVALHATPADGWIALFGNVYDVTPWIATHPGGNVIEHGLGKDATQMFLQIGHSMNAYQALQSFFVGILS